MADISAEAREILDKFGADLKGVKIGSKSVKSSKTALRQEKNGENCDKQFKAIMFKNAKSKNDSYLLLEKGSW